MIDLNILTGQLEEYREALDELELAFQPEKIKDRITELENLTYEADFWQDVERAKQVQKELTHLKKKQSALQDVQAKYEDLLVLCELAKEETDPAGQKELFDSLETALANWTEEMATLRLQVYFTGDLDSNNAILTLHAGAGGTEACDWTSMLFRMYERWAEHHAMEVKVLDSVDGDEAGIKSITFHVSGDYAYGMLKTEMGVHRLVRISPFDSSGRRHTSFASLEVLPELDRDIEIDIREEDLRTDYYRSSGAGGQHVNKTSSAVRITHLPTGVVVACQNERSQLQNRETAMAMLKAKLFTLARSRQLEKIDELKGDQKDIAWGSQIRSYVFCPYTLVKDNRTGFENPDITAVMDGEIDSFIETRLAQLAAAKNREDGA